MKNIYLKARRLILHKLLKINKKIKCLIPAMFLILIPISYFVLNYKIEASITTSAIVWENNSFILLPPKYINIVGNNSQIILKYQDKYIDTKIKKIEYDTQISQFKIELYSHPSMLPNSTIKIELIYDNIKL